MQKKVFWLLFTVVSSITGLTLSIYWNLSLALPLWVVCWWVVYRSGWFDLYLAYAARKKIPSCGQAGGRRFGH
jgi:hypothetical protein